MTSIRSYASPIDCELIKFSEQLLRENGVFPTGRYVAATIEPATEWGGYFEHTESMLVAYTPAGGSGTSKVPLMRCPDPTSKIKVYYNIDDKYNNTVYVDVVVLRENNFDGQIATCITYQVKDK